MAGNDSISRELGVKFDMRKVVCVVFIKTNVTLAWFSADIEPRV